MDPKGFFASLFDFSFTEFLTIKIIKLLFILGIIGAALGSLFYLIKDFGLSSLLIAPLIFIASVFLLRIWLELVMVVFRIADNTTQLVDLGRKNSAATTNPF